MCAAAVLFVLLYQATATDSRTVGFRRGAILAAGARTRFIATAYCKGTTTASGVRVRSGIAAADPDILPLGSIIQIDGISDRHDGVYTVLDTGPMVRGRRLDLYMWSCYEALSVGRRSVMVTVLRRGWRPNDEPEDSARPLDRPAGVPEVEAPAATAVATEPSSSEPPALEAPVLGAPPLDHPATDLLHLEAPVE
jgi:3D (Asp-Asp-Asp) domain-containing protein